MFGELLGRLGGVEAWERLGRPEPVPAGRDGPRRRHADERRPARRPPRARASWRPPTSGWWRPPSRCRPCSASGSGEAPSAGPRAWPRSPAARRSILIANELLDCLPARQFVRTAARLGRAGGGPRPPRRARLRPRRHRRSPTCCPTPPSARSTSSPPPRPPSARRSAHRIARDGGAALLIDYGRAEPGFGDTLQALKRHEKVDPLARPGEADLTVHVDFPAVMDAARAEGAEAGDPHPGRPPGPARHRRARRGPGPRPSRPLRHASAASSPA